MECKPPTLFCSAALLASSFTPIFYAIFSCALTSLCPLCLLLKDLRYDSMKVAALMHQVVDKK